MGRYTDDTVDIVSINMDIADSMLKGQFHEIGDFVMEYK
jgi:hypothetical protein